ncbi:MAG: hypothetical protein JNL60_19395 [Bacteroidia bacterium]|nr:hypothetical protein [Bacteroidia bacterium]
MAVYVYVEHLSAKHGDNAFKKKFQVSTFYNEKYKALLAQFDTLRLNYTYEFEQYPFSSKIPGMTEGLLKKCLVSSANLKDFKRKAIGIIPNSDLLQLSAILYDFQQVYRELVYQPVKAKFEKQLAEVTEFVKTKNISAYVDKGLFFYKSYWEESFPFEIAFYPLPYPEGFTAEAFYNTAVSGLRSDNKDYITLVSVMLHEIFHMLYDEQPVSVKRNISSWFAANPAPCGTYAYLLLNEALATALGNGYVFNSLAGKADEDDWYDRKYINDIAKKIYPLVSDYISQKKPIDEAFVNSYIKIYDENYGNWINELDNLMCYRYVLSDNMSDYDVIRNKYRYASYSQFEDQVNEYSLAKLQNTKLTKVVIVSKENEAKLALVKKQFPELKNWKYKAKQEFFYATQLDDKTQIIIINTLKSSTEKMFEGMVLLPQQIEKK